MSTSPISFRVLYVEDNPADVHILQATLQNLHTTFELTMLDDGAEALHFIDSKPFQPDVIVLDLNIPMIDGLTVLAALKADSTLKSIPVLVFVPPNSPNSRNAEALKADLHLSNPVDFDG